MAYRDNSRNPFTGQQRTDRHKVRKIIYLRGREAPSGVLSADSGASKGKWLKLFIGESKEKVISVKKKTTFLSFCLSIF